MTVGPVVRADTGSPAPGVYARWGKPFLDRSLAAAGLVSLAPVLLLVAVLVLVDVGFPILFRQRRPGLHGQLFQMVKFRTMREPSPGADPLKSDAARVTGIGRVLRAWSLDELPELWNVVRGEMSLVGPRPLLPEYLPRYSSLQRRRHDVRPGITGWSQVNGRNAQSWEERLAMDVWYVENQSFFLDLRILASTVVKVFKREGVSAAGHVTMPPFEGTDGE
jgi:lipopolysaccharide/colanic/teichoic acid biosynthesis glycosyltransferase